MISIEGETFQRAHSCNQTSIYSYGPTIRVRSDHTRMVGPYEYTHMVMTIRVWSKYSYGPEHIYVV